jgi:hypothetical protein
MEALNTQAKFKKKRAIGSIPSWLTVDADVDDDWSKVEDLGKRHRLQNKIAIRKNRRICLEEKLAEEGVKPRFMLRNGYYSCELEMYKVGARQGLKRKF